MLFNPDFFFKLENNFTKSLFCFHVMKLLFIIPQFLILYIIILHFFVVVECFCKVLLHFKRIVVI